MKKWQFISIIIIGMIIITSAFFMAGFEVRDKYFRPEPEKVFVEIIIYPPPTPPEIIIETIEVIKEVPIPIVPREFKNMTEIAEFIKDLNIEEFVEPDWDCDDYAYFVWSVAMRDGYFMSFESDYKKGQLHALNSTVVGNKVYFIEPQEGKIWLYGLLD